MKYERMTKRDEDGTVKYIGGDKDTLGLCYDKLKYRLAELEDMIENGELQEVPEGSVVLTREELVKTMESGYVYNTTSGDKINLIEMAREIERKETGERIYEKAKKKKYIDNDDEGCYWGAIALDDLADICGVEV